MKMATLSEPFAEVAQRHRRELLAYLVRLLGPGEAEDICQETFSRAWSAFGRLRPDSNARAWLYRIATNVALNHLRRRRREAARIVQSDLELIPATAPPDADERERLARVVRAVNSLPGKQRSALLQRLFQELDYREIGLVLGCTPEAARANVYQALRKLRRQLAGL